MLKNGSFENGWNDLVVGGVTRNQEPKDWELSWVPPGGPLYGSPDDKALGVPECVHKHRDQLPTSEHPGQPGALILDGVYVYKIFHSDKPFGAELVQAIRGLEPGTVAQVSVPVLLDAHGATDPYGAEACIRLGNMAWAEQWFNAENLGHREWKRIVVEVNVPASGELILQMLFKSKWGRAVDFFIDDIKFDCTVAGPPPPPPPPPPSDDAIVITVIVPAGVEVEVERV